MKGLRKRLKLVKKEVVEVGYYQQEEDPAVEDCETENPTVENCETENLVIEHPIPVEPQVEVIQLAEDLEVENSTGDLTIDPTVEDDPAPEDPVVEGIPLDEGPMIDHPVLVVKEVNNPVVKEVNVSIVEEGIPLNEDPTIEYPAQEPVVAEVVKIDSKIDSEIYPATEELAVLK